MAEEKQVFWLSKPPTRCETCSNDIKSIFYDAKTRMGPWACMCSMCFYIGPGIGQLGTGFGQKYELQEDGKWLKTGG